jgi:hypothetical protein
MQKLWHILSTLIALGSVITPASAVSPRDWLVAPAGSFPARIVRSGGEVALDNGLIRRTFRLAPDAATVGLRNEMTDTEMLRAVKPEATLTIDGVPCAVGGLTGQPVGNYLKPEWLAEMKAADGFRCVGVTDGATTERFPYKPRTAWLSQGKAAWPPHGVALSFDYRAGETLLAKFSARSADAGKAIAGLTVTVHYELYDGLPLIEKWVTVRNAGATSVTLDTFTPEMLALTEDAFPALYANDLPPELIERIAPLHVVTDYAFGGDMEAARDNLAVHWKFDPDYSTDLGYGDQFKPALLDCTPPLKPGVVVAPGATVATFRVFELAYDATDRERRGLEARRMMRTVAPWSQENPILMHVRSADPAAVKLAIDQCANVGFEMVILTFGSGFDIENTSPAYLAQMKALADYAHARGIAIGGYSLLASRGASPENSVVNPAPRFGQSPCLGSAWGLNYFKTLRNFFAVTGMDVLENDGSYPGDTCASTVHPGHTGLGDSQWRQWEIIRDFYQECRGRGVYLNVPDWYFLEGANKTPMGYVEANWSLPRQYQEIIERQEVYDGTFEKTPSMGWMFVPLTQYHGGGAAATIEPLKDHLDQYEARLADLFGAGVQACYRGPRLYDAPETEAVVKRWVDFYRAHRAILDADVIHLRRPDGRDWDGMLHVAPNQSERGLAMLYNPLPTPIERDITLPLYYTGLTDRAVIVPQRGKPYTIRLARDYSATVHVTIPAHGNTYLVVKEVK